MENRIAIPRAQAITHKSDFFRDGFISMAIIGKSGCGKSEMLASILPGIAPVFKTVLIATVIHNSPVHLAIRDYFRKKGVYCGISESPTELRRYVDVAEQMEVVTMAAPGLMIFDDFNVGKATGEYWDFVVHAFTKLRNSGWHFIIIAQQPSFLPTIVRNCTTARVLFDCYSKSAITSFTKDIIDRVPNRIALATLMDYIKRVQFTYILVRENPFEVSVGKGNQTRTVLTEHDVVVPTLKDLMKEMGATSPTELDAVSKRAQIEAGNTSHLLYQ